MEKKKFPSVKMILPYQGKYVLATLQEEDNIIHPLYFITFPDGFKNSFFPWEDQFTDKPDNEDLWAEDGLGISELAKQISPYLDYYLVNKDKYIEPLNLEADDNRYIVQPVDIDNQMQYRVYGILGEYFCTLQMNNDAVWEVAEEEGDPVGGDGNVTVKLAKELGDLIEQQTM